MEQTDDAINDDNICNGIKQPDENADNQDTSDDDEGVLQHLLGGGPDDLLQLALQLAEVLADGTPGSLEPVFFFDFRHSCGPSLLGLVVSSVLSAESAVLLHFETVRVVLLVFHGIVVSLLALGASQSDFNAHNGTSLKLPPCITSARKNLDSGHYNCRPKLKKGIKIKPFFTGRTILSQDLNIVNNFFT